MSSKRKVKMEVKETKQIKIEAYCILCQRYGHSISEECVTTAICHHCGIKGHVSRDCKEERLMIKDEVKEELKEESSDWENEYVEREIPKDEPINEVDSESDWEVIEFKKDTNEEYIEKEEDDKKKVKVEVYCILCQIYGHTSSEACVVNAKCFACGIEGHVRRDCKDEKCQLKNVKVDVKSESIKWELKDVKLEEKKESIKCEEDEEEYVEAEVDKNELKTEMNQECNRNVTERELEGNISFYSTTINDNIEKEFSMNPTNTQNEKYAFTQSKKSLRKCSVNLFKLNIELSKHITIRAQQEGVDHACQKCNFKTKSKKALTIHVQAQHEGVRYACKDCNFKAKYKTSLRTHIQAEHKDAENYKHTFTTNNQAENQAVLYSCNECNYNTKNKSNLTNHKRGQHEGVLYSCKECNYTTKYKGDLTRHI